MKTAQGIQRASSEDRYEALFRVTKAIAECDDSDDMADTFTRKLREVIPLDYLQFVGFDPRLGLLRAASLKPTAGARIALRCPGR